MGKEQELLDAARIGNIGVIERILAVRLKRAGPLANLGPLASLRRMPNPNCLDPNGDTPLHHAALNGHKEAVETLLRFEACANMSDNKGCFPLHLAAFNGHADICKMLLVHGPSYANVNEQNEEGETPLLCGSQYGHTEVVNVLLEYKADPLLRNRRNESPLDLASQYGRLDTVTLLLRKCPGILAHTAHPSSVVLPVSPLHLAARNGHRHVVQTLLDNGANVNCKTVSGTALHEASLFCKADVVRLLLLKGVDTDVVDRENRTVIDVLSDQRSPISLEIGKLILEHIKIKVELPPRLRVRKKALYDDVPVSRPVRPPRRSDPGRASTSSHCSSSLSDLFSSRPEGGSSGGIGSGIGGRPQPHRRSAGSDIVDPTGGSRESLTSCTSSSYCDTPPSQPRSYHSNDSSCYSSFRGACSSPASLLAENGGSPRGHYYSSSSPQDSPYLTHYTHKHSETPKKPPRRRTFKKSQDSLRSQDSLSSTNTNTDCSSISSCTHFYGNTDTIKHNPLPNVVYAGSSMKDTNRVLQQQGSTAAPGEVSTNGNDGVGGNITAMADNGNHHHLHHVHICSGGGNDDFEHYTSDQVNQNVGLATTTTALASTQMIGVDNVPQQGSSSSSRRRRKSLELENNNEIKQRTDALNRNDAAAAATTSSSAASVAPPASRNEKRARDEQCLSLTHQQQQQQQGDSGLPPSSPQSSTTPSSRPPSLEIGGSKRSSREVPLSPTGYEQPPTPDFPPPSPMTALQGIAEKINPNDKRRSRDMETITETEFLTSVHLHHPHHHHHHHQHQAAAQGRGRMADSQTETELREEVEDAAAAREVLEGATAKQPTTMADARGPFWGLTKGSVQFGKRRVKSQIYEQIFLHPAAKQKHRVSAPGGYHTYDPRHPLPPTLPEGDDFEGSEDNLRAASKLELLRRGGRQSQEWTYTLTPDVDAITAPTTADNLKRKSRASSASVSAPVAVVNGARSRTYDRNSNALLDGAGAAGSGVKGSSSATPRLGNIPANMTQSMCGRIGGGGEEEDTISPLDENEEWAEISELLSSVGGRMSVAGDGDTGYFEQRIANFFNKGKGGKCSIQSVGEWLDELELSQYENIFIAHGFDDMDFMGPDILEDTDLLDMGILNESHRQTLLSAVTHLPPLLPLLHVTPAPASVHRWLQTLNLTEHVDAFLQRGYDTMERVRRIGELDINYRLEITSLGHRKRLLASLRGAAPPVLDENAPPQYPPVGMRLSDEEEEDDTLFKDYTNLTSQRPRKDDRLRRSKTLPEQQHPQDSSVDGSNHSSSSPLVIRPPNLGTAESPIKQWRHRPEALIKGCCNYSAQYLGSTFVKNLQGNESTKESITRMKKSSEGITEVPTIVLSISYRGVKFINVRSKKVICEHDISNIFCAAQDGDHLNYFAYITKDLLSDKHFCHVFSVKNTEQATEIILTLGEAFEVAYQIAKRERRIVSQHSLPLSQSSMEDGTVAAAAAVGAEGEEVADNIDDDNEHDDVVEEEVEGATGGGGGEDGADDLPPPPPPPQRASHGKSSASAVESEI